MNYYSFSVEDGEFAGSGEARQNPLHPEQFLLPAHATFTAPPELKAHEAAIWNGSLWAVIPDFRGQIVYYVATGEPVIVADRGALPETVTQCECPAHCRGYCCYDGVTWIPDEARRTELLVIAKSQADAATIEQLAAGFEFAGSMFPLSGALYAQNMNAASAYAYRGMTAGRNLFTLDGGYIMVTDIAGLIATGDDAATTICMNGIANKAALETKTTGELLEIINS